MLFKNKIEYTKGMFVEIYGTEIKKVRLVLRIITGIAVVAAIAFMIYGAAARGFIMPGNVPLRRFRQPEVSPRFRQIRGSFAGTAARFWSIRNSFYKYGF